MLRSKITVEREKLCMFTCCRILYFIHSNVVQIAGSPSGIYKAVQKESSSVTGQTLLDVNPQRISNPGKDDSQDTLKRWWLHYSESGLLPRGLAWALWTIAFYPEPCVPSTISTAPACYFHVPFVLWLTCLEDYCFPGSKKTSVREREDSC